MGFYRELALRTRAFVWSKRNQEAAEKSSEKHRQYKDFSFVRAVARVKTHTEKQFFSDNYHRYQNDRPW
jgi:hypothetical protein